MTLEDNKTWRMTPKETRQQKQKDYISAMSFVLPLWPETPRKQTLFLALR